MSTNVCMPRAMFQTGVILSATLARGHDQPRTVRIGQEESGFEALAFSSPWLDEAVNGPLHAWVVQLAHAEGGSPLPILLGLEEEPFSSGLKHLPDEICPIAGTVGRIKELISEIKTYPLRAFVTKVFERRDVVNAFWTMPASGRDHHSYPGGLAVHSGEVADDLAVHLGLTPLEADLGVAGALLHDIGKIWSYTDDMFPNAASLAMGHELVGLCRLEPELARLEQTWPDGAFVMRCLLSGNSRMRENGSLPSALLQRIKACDQRSCERERAAHGSRRSSRPVWTPNAWEDRPAPVIFEN